MGGLKKEILLLSNLNLPVKRITKQQREQLAKFLEEAESELEPPSRSLKDHPGSKKALPKMLAKEWTDFRVVDIHPEGERKKMTVLGDKDLQTYRYIFKFCIDIGISP